MGICKCPFYFKQYLTHNQNSNRSTFIVSIHLAESFIYMLRILFVLKASVARSGGYLMMHTLFEYRKFIKLHSITRYVYQLKRLRARCIYFMRKNTHTHKHFLIYHQILSSFLLRGFATFKYNETSKSKIRRMQSAILLAHLSQTLIGELIGYEFMVRRPSVVGRCPS